MRKYLKHLKILAIALLFFVLGAGSTFFALSNQVKNLQDETIAAINNSVAGLEACQDMYQSCANAYNITAACMSNLPQCNIANEREKLVQYNQDRIEAEERFKKITQEAGLLLNNAGQQN